MFLKLILISADDNEEDYIRSNGNNDGSNGVGSVNETQLEWY